MGLTHRVPRGACLESGPGLVKQRRVDLSLLCRTAVVRTGNVPGIRVDRVLLQMAIQFISRRVADVVRLQKTHRIRCDSRYRTAI